MLVLTSSEPEGATILIQLGTCPVRFVTTDHHNDDGVGDDNDNDTDKENSHGYLVRFSNPQLGNLTNGGGLCTLLAR